MKLKTEFIDPDKAERLLGLTIGDKSLSPDRLVKSFYQFDFNTPEGITTFLTLLPVLDKEVVEQAQNQLLPGSVTEEYDLPRARFELRGFLIDVLNEGIEGEQEEMGLEEDSSEENLDEEENLDGL